MIELFDEIYIRPFRDSAHISSDKKRMRKIIPWVLLIMYIANIVWFFNEPIIEFAANVFVTVSVAMPGIIAGVILLVLCWFAMYFGAQIVIALVVTAAILALVCFGSAVLLLIGLAMDSLIGLMSPGLGSLYPATQILLCLSLISAWWHYTEE